MQSPARISFSGSKLVAAVFLVVMLCLCPGILSVPMSRKA
jgi:hypothetical protein